MIRSVVLTTRRLRLRALQEDDIERVAIFEDARKGLTEAVAHWSAHGYGQFVVLKRDVVVGLAGLARSRFDHGRGVELRWHFRYDDWGRGYATEALRAVISDGLARVGLTNIMAITAATDQRSRRVFKRLGMTHSRSEDFDDPREPKRPRRLVIYRLRGSDAWKR
jgi:RimJ/RimL family protein N-acetyltransferase